MLVTYTLDNYVISKPLLEQDTDSDQQLTIELLHGASNKEALQHHSDAPNTDLPAIEYLGN